MNDHLVFMKEINIKKFKRRQNLKEIIINSKQNLFHGIFQYVSHIYKFTKHYLNKLLNNIQISF
jgi:hypothetical protein